MTLYCGIGGGYDIFGALPLYFKFSGSGSVSGSSHKEKSSCLVNLSFTNEQTILDQAYSQYVQQLAPHIYKIMPSIVLASHLESCYFPEARLALHLQHPVIALVIHAIGDAEPLTIQQVASFLSSLIQQEGLSRVVAADAGCDSLMTGAEFGLGTPSEDMLMLKALTLACELSPLHHRDHVYLSCVGVDADTAHGVRKRDLNQRLMALKPELKMRWVLRPEQKHFQEYKAAVEACQPSSTIIHSFVVAAAEGLRGKKVPANLKSRITSRIHVTQRMHTVFVYRLHQVTNSVGYFNKLLPCHSLDQVDSTIAIWHHRLHVTAHLKPRFESDALCNLILHYLLLLEGHVDEIHVW